MLPRCFAVLGALLAGLAVLIGAYHAHGMAAMLSSRGLTETLVEKQLGNTDVALRYQMAHALALLILAGWLEMRPSRLLGVGCWLILLGLAGFSGGLYAGVFSNWKPHWAIVPSGGLTLIAAWLLIAFALGVSRRGPSLDSTKC